MYWTDILVRVIAVLLNLAACVYYCATLSLMMIGSRGLCGSSFMLEIVVNKRTLHCILTLFRLIISARHCSESKCSFFLGANRLDFFIDISL
jgi:hypothetical protein